MDHSIIHEEKNDLFKEIKYNSVWIKHLEIKKQTALIHILSKACSDHPYNMLFKYIILTGHMLLLWSFNDFLKICRYYR